MFASRSELGGPQQEATLVGGRAYAPSWEWGASRDQGWPPEEAAVASGAATDDAALNALRGQRRARFGEHLVPSRRAVLGQRHVRRLVHGAHLPNKGE